MVKNNTKVFFRELAIAKLINEGWEVEKKKGYILASYPKKGEEKDIIICSVGRILSSSKSKKKIQAKDDESTTVSITEETIYKMIKYAELLEKNYLPCICYGIAKYTIDDLEIYIVPVDVINEEASSSDVYSITGGRYHYNYNKLIDRNKPTGAIIRTCWK